MMTDLSNSFCSIRSRQGEQRERPPPRNGKNCGRKMMLPQKDLFFATNFPKIVKKSFFILNCYKKCKISQPFVFFVKTH